MIQSTFDFLENAISDGGRVALSSVVSLARNNRELELKAPAIAAMICWGEQGLIEIKNLALSDPTSKNVSAALKTLAAVAVGESVESLLFLSHSQDFTDVINRCINDANLRSVAKHELSDLVFSISSEDLLIPLGVAFTQLSLSGENLAGEVISALSTKWLRFGPRALKQYDEMLKSNANDEASFQQFFVQFPQFLDPMAIQVWCQPAFHGALIPDFVIRRADNSYLIVEIECPGKPLVTRTNNLTAHATHAEKQTTEYKSFLTERAAEARIYFPHFRTPDTLAVIGLERGLKESQRQALVNSNATRHNHRTVGFDWLGDRANTIVANMSSGGIDVVSGHRMI